MVHNVKESDSAISSVIDCIDLCFGNSKKIPFVLRRMSCGSPPSIAANEETYKSKLSDYKGMSESTGYLYITSDEKRDNIVEDSFKDEGVEAEDNTQVYIAIHSDSSSSDENAN